jgi:abnormal spindle-like microcephaly-associated protein
MAARTIQTHWRKVVDRSAFVNKLVATILIQNFHRGVAVRREILLQNQAAGLIQRKWRLHAYSLLQNDAATELQRHWRANICRKKLHLTMASSISVQKVWRGFAARDHYARCRFAATIVQTIWRSHSARLNYELDVLEIVIAQSVVRRYVSQKLVARRWHAIQVIQNVARRQKAVDHLEMLRRMRTEYQELAQATILAQVRPIIFSGLCVTIEFSISFILFQSFVRRLIAQNHRQRKIEAIVVTQTWWRAHICHQRYCKLKSGVKAMQASFRGGRERQQQSSHHRNATVIQCQWRCFSSNVKYNLAHADIVTAQSMFRRHLAARFAAEKRRSILLLQAVVRRWKARRRVHDLLVQLATEWLESSASTVIQSLYRGHSIRQQQSSLNRNATVIQCRWRFFSSYVKYNLAHADIVNAQSIVRRHLAARFAAEKRRSILLLQAVVRRWKARRRFHDLRAQLATEWLESSASTVIQSLYRGHSTRQQQNSLHGKATVIQCQWRFFSSYAKYNLARADIVTAQSIVRRQLAARFAAEKKRSILLLQAVVRRWKARCRVHDLRVQLAKEWLVSSTSTVIQSLYRGHATRLGQRLKHAQAAVIQAAFRGYIARLCFDMDRMDVTIIQSFVRRWLATRSLDKKKNCVLQIQKASRLWIACHRVNLIRMQQKREWIDNSAALMVQSVYRGHVVRRRIETQHEKAIVVQSAFRGHCMRLWYEMYLVDLTIIQSVVRRWLVYRKFRNQQQSVVVIQTLVRRRIATQAASVLRSTKLHMDIQNLASVAIQRLWRAYVSRLSSGKHAAARKIQKTWRCFDAHVNFLYQVMSILTVQTLVRRCLARRSYQRTVRGFVKMQALARGNFERRELRLASLSAIIIQSAFRAKYERTIFEQRKHAAVTIQRWARGYFCRVDLDIASFAASEIQRVWRGYSQFVDFALLVISAIKVQTHFRMRLSMKAYREKKLALWAKRAFVNRKALLIQRAFRLHAYRQKLERAARTMQISVRAYIHRKRIGMVKRGIARLQAVFRARLVRRRRPKKVHALAGRVVRANTRAKEDPKLRLGYRTSRALHILQTSASLAEIMDAVKSLETSTRLSIVCCVLFTEAKATHILLELMRSCNRSVPHVELVQCILLTLDNVAQHRTLAPSFADCNSAEVFLDKMQLFRDKDGIFCLSISLLNSIAACNPVVEVSIDSKMTRFFASND